MPLYFAYGSNMGRDAMAVRCPASRPLGLARLARHRVVIMREGFASIAPDPRRIVIGMLWDLAFADVPALDRYEGVARGLYRKCVLSVLGEDGPRRALVYVGANAGPGAPRAGYLESVMDPGRAAGLPAAYLDEIAALGGRGLRGSGEGQGPDRWTAGRDVPAVRPMRRTPLDRPPSDGSAGWRWEP